MVYDFRAFKIFINKGNFKIGFNRDQIPKFHHPDAEKNDYLLTEEEEQDITVTVPLLTDDNIRTYS